MHIKQLECFVQLAKTLNFSRTAEILHLTQPAVTHQINKLEEELGFSLFKRTKRHVELTSAGTSFYQDVEDILTRINIAVTKARFAETAFKTNLMINYDSFIPHLPNMLKKYRQIMPHVYLYLNTSVLRYKRELLINNKLDVIFTSHEGLENLDDFTFFELFNGYFSFALCKNHPLANKSVLNFDDLQGWDFIFFDAMRAPDTLSKLQNELHHKCPNATIFFAEDILSKIVMVKSGMGIAIVPSFAVTDDPDLVLIPVIPLEKISYGMAWKKNDTRAELLAFINIVKEFYDLPFTNP